ncbi:MAG: T9SS type A sorting domain-containing protein [Bacteroidetes bacterium]|nr:T9SS type A sorting domain-containing protein [Bacteroidota bacterium]
MKRLFTLLILLYSIFSSGQDWVHTGSTWAYSYSEMGGMGYVVYKYDKDTTVAGEYCHLLKGTNYAAAAFGPMYRYDTTSSVFYTFSKNDTVFFYHQTYQLWSATYFFSAQTGDSITMCNPTYQGNQDTMVHAVVDTTGTLSISSTPLRFYKFHLTDTCSMGWYGQGTVIERLGIQDNAIVPYWHCVTDDTYFGFCSYEDDSFAIYKPNIHCDELPTGMSEIEAATGTIYPNPAQDMLTLRSEIPAQDRTAVITDLQGKELLQMHISSAEERISLANLSTGVYLIMVSEKGKQSVRQKLIVSR